ncbi:MAG: Exosome complex component Csl4 [Methanosaeta sp. PtaB.Bin039]|nr:MAG: Exosome complex component Csl4 [Methanosaeta sp. PtaB.Bin039]OPY46775.1 MAG: Exosome complex component Csl4 [Methanosaeta sp. PtaU1.Bin028]HOT07099.1 exosome complex RNA-binding protein Csl4 [Methanotrichaceae archaeon]HQF17044.1 exosome complex RNA-binding protein Csl4 [Methanotrichaceae archaeon]HQI91664.1 exosome complex RNA-binding protein Csl4 [Methanotrichaceae archaeon]
MSEMTNGCMVLPGDRVGSVEEYVPGQETYVRSGFIYASTTGTVEVDPETRSARVVPISNAPPRLEQGDIVVGEVVDMKESLVILSLAFKKGYEYRPLPDEEATIHISNVKNSYVKDLRQMFSLRDIIKARIVDDRQMRLTTGEDDLGVIKAYCSRCMTGLQRKESRLECPSCKHSETRKLSASYGLGVV